MVFDTVDYAIGFVFLSAKVASFFWRLPLTLRSALKATLAANALNMFIPRKLGDPLKAVTMTEDEPNRFLSAVSLGFWEKLSDLAFLLSIASVQLALLGHQRGCAFLPASAGTAGVLASMFPGMLTAPIRRIAKLKKLAARWKSTLITLRSNYTHLPMLFSLALVMWPEHLIQITLMTHALGVECSLTCWGQIIAAFPVVIVAGQIPMTFAGVGVWDAASVAPLSPSLWAPFAAALGVLFSLRYLVPGLFGSLRLPQFFKPLHNHVTLARK